MTNASSMKDLPAPPPASFRGIVEMFASQALASMGAIPEAGSEKRLDYAKYFIDLLQIIEEKSKPQLTAEEASMLEQTLAYLRMGYVQATSN